MSTGTSIEWTSATWSPVVGCTRVSAGCDHCYAYTLTKRLEAMGQEKYSGLAGKGHFNGVARLHAPSLDAPLRWRKGRRIFVNPMSDLFHEGLAFEEIAAVFGVMAAAPRHTFQVLTKRPQRALEFFRWVDSVRQSFPPDLLVQRHAYSALVDKSAFPLHSIKGTIRSFPWPLLNVWLGVSVEDQATADERIPLLLQCPAAVRFVSYEPALGPVDFTRVSYLAQLREQLAAFAERQGRDGAEAIANYVGPAWLDVMNGRWDDGEDSGSDGKRIDWVIVGGESGHGARPFDVAWARSTVAQCKAAGAACFVKQLGARPHEPYGEAPSTWGAGVRVDHAPGCPAGARYWIRLRNGKGGDWSEWPEDLRVRDFPQGAPA